MRTSLHMVTESTATLSAVCVWSARWWWAIGQTRWYRADVYKRQIIEDSMGSRAKKLFIIFALPVLILVIASFVNIVAGTFLTLADDAGKTAFGFVTNPAGNQSTAMISLLFIGLAVIYGYVTNRMGVKTLPATIGGITVSYTHLEVYKRQVWKSTRRTKRVRC